MSKHSFLGFPAVITSFIMLGLLLAPAATGKKSIKPPSGESVYKSNCAQCHPGGGNIVNQSKPLRGAQELESFPTFKQYLENPQGHMPYYKHVISDDAALHALYKYCKSIKPGKQS